MVLDAALGAQLEDPVRRGLVGLAHRDLRYQPLEDLPVDGRNLDPRRPVFCLKVRFVPQEERPVPLRVHRLQDMLCVDLIGADMS